MTTRRTASRVPILAVLVLALAGCGWADKPVAPAPPAAVAPEPTPSEYDRADLARGGALYDRFWSVTGAAAPTTDHPLWSTRPDPTSNPSTREMTWRCVECHGWDYRGSDGAFGAGEHRTGFPGVRGTHRSPRQVFDLIRDAHGYGAAGLPDSLIWDLTRFVFEGAIDTGELIDAHGAFRSDDLFNGELLFNVGIGGGFSCTGCHGTDGLTAPPGADPETFDRFPGRIARTDPWAFQHKVRFGQPGTLMPSAVVEGGTLREVIDLGAFVQTLPQTP